MPPPYFQEEPEREGKGIRIYCRHRARAGQARGFCPLSLGHPPGVRERADQSPGTFDGTPYEGSLVNMGVKNADGSVCYIIGVRKDVQAQLGKGPGDAVHVTIQELGREDAP